MSVIKYKDPNTGEWVKVGGIFSDTSSDSSVPAYVRAEAGRVAKVVQSRQNPDTITFLACSDIHYAAPDNGNPHRDAAQMREAAVSMGQAMRLIRERVHIDFAAMFGDMIWDSNEGSVDEVLSEMQFVNACLQEGFFGLPQFRMKGNHDDACDSGNNLSANQIFSNLGIWNDGAVYGSREAGYCYRDFEAVKLRVICLNSTEYSGNGFLTTAEQVAWLADALNLSNKGEGWQSIILSHHPLEWDKAGGVNPIDTVNASDGLIASFHGHIHNFLTGTVAGTELPRIAIPNAGYSRENQYEAWKESTTYTKKPGTAENTSFCVVTIDLAAKKIYADHYGAGYDRMIPYGDAEVETYTVTNHLTAVTNSNASVTAAEGTSYTAVLTVEDGYELKSVAVTMGGADITDSAYGGGRIHIGSVSGDVVITAYAEAVAGGNYTNLVPAATTAPGGTEIYNSVGYRDGYYISSGNAYNQDANCVAVGYLQFSPGDVIYIKGAELAALSHVRIYTQSMSGAAYAYCDNPPAGNGVWKDAQGNERFVIEQLGSAYYRITPNHTFVEPMYYRVSLYGTGANLIITHNEPIE